MLRNTVKTDFRFGSGGDEEKFTNYDELFLKSSPDSPPSPFIVIHGSIQGVAFDWP